MADIKQSLVIYRKHIEYEAFRKAYAYLLKYVMRLRSHFSNHQADKFSVGNVSPGYMDFTYFPFFNDFLRARKLRFGIVLNHQAMRFEIWLMGQNASVQKQYWDILRNSQWNVGCLKMPHYSVLESVLIADPDFDNEELLTLQIEKEAIFVVKEVLEYIRANDVNLLNS